MIKNIYNQISVNPPNPRYPRSNHKKQIPTPKTKNKSQINYASFRLSNLLKLSSIICEICEK